MGIGAEKALKVIAILMTLNTSIFIVMCLNPDSVGAWLYKVDEARYENVVDQ